MSVVTLSVTGKFSPAENLLHVCTRQKLSQSVDVLLQPWFIEGKAQYLLQKGYNHKTPVEIAKKHNMVSVSDTAEQLIVRVHEAEVKGRNMDRA